MRKFAKGCLVTAAILLASGSAFCAAALAGGEDLSGIRTFVFHRKQGGVHHQGHKEFEASYQGIRKLDFDVGVAHMEIVPSEDDCMYVEGSSLSASFQCEQDGDTLEIEHGSKFTALHGESAQITVRIPREMMLEEADIDVGVGSLQAEILRCGKLKLSCGMGSVSIRGEVCEEQEIDCGLGEVCLNLENEKEDFNYKIECGMGEVVLGEDSYSGLAMEKQIDHHAKADMDIKCGMGSVIVTFGNK